MAPGVITCAPDARPETVTELMATHHVHAVAVGAIAANQLVWGVIDSLDLVRSLHDPDAANGLSASYRPRVVRRQGGWGS